MQSLKKSNSGLAAANTLNNAINANRRVTRQTINCASLITEGLPPCSATVMVLASLRDAERHSLHFLSECGKDTLGFGRVTDSRSRRIETNGIHFLITSTIQQKHNLYF